MKLFNFSHPLPGLAKGQIQDAIGKPFKEIIIKTQFDLDKPLGHQVNVLCSQAHKEHGYPDLMIPPALSAAASLTTEWFSKPQDDFPPHTIFVPVVWLKRVDLRGFVLGGIVGYYDYPQLSAAGKGDYANEEVRMLPEAKQCAYCGRRRKDLSWYHYKDIEPGFYHQVCIQELWEKKRNEN